MLILAVPCVVSVALDEGQKAKCDGILISAEKAKEAVACKRELNIRRTFECDPCPACPESKQQPTLTIASASFFSGLVLGILLFFVS
tara:strand:- start:7730 stop:7990 length:261 start_codon:yes stop_codon:yes gene_type:complete